MHRPINDKRALRQTLKQKRAALDPQKAKEWNASIIDCIARSPLFASADLLLLYAPKGSELNLLPLVALAHKKGIPVAFPVSMTETTTLQFRILTPDKGLVPGTYGIPEPPADAPVAEPTDRTLCILPGLAFSPNGSRIGYGKGYYDRFLATFPGTAVGALYEEMLTASIPTEPHDLPAAYLFTERGIIRCADHRKGVKPKEKPSAAASLSNLWHSLCSRLRAMRPTAVRAADPSPLPVAKPLHLPPLLVLGIFLLLILSRAVEVLLFERSNATVGVMLLQILIFILPAILYSRLKGERFGKRMRLNLPRFEHTWFLFCILAVMITGSLLTCILTGGIASLTGDFTLYNTFTAHSDGGILNILAIIIAYALLPAFGEELIFRSYLCAEYEHLGVGVSITVSALFFAMLHFSLPLLLTYLFLGALLAAAMYATRSLLAVILLHAGYNIFCLFGQPYLSAFYLYAGSNDIFLFFLITLFLLFSAFAAGEARKIYHIYAISNRSSDYTSPRPLRTLPRTLWHALKTPTVAVCLTLWLVMSLVDLLA